MGMSKSIRERALERSGYACQMCGACDGDPDEYYPVRKVRLHVSRLIGRRKGWSDTPSNLRVLCTMCYRGVRQLPPEPPSPRPLFEQIRMADHDDQARVLTRLKENPPALE